MSVYVCVYVRRALRKIGDFAYKGLKCRWLRALSVSSRVSKVFGKSRKALIYKGLRVSRFVSRILLTVGAQALSAPSACSRGQARGYNAANGKRRTNAPHFDSLPHILHFLPLDGSYIVLEKISDLNANFGLLPFCLHFPTVSKIFGVCVGRRKQKGLQPEDYNPILRSR
mgnify:CR=1 FL=1